MVVVVVAVVVVSSAAAREFSKFCVARKKKRGEKFPSISRYYFYLEQDSLTETGRETKLLFLREHRAVRAAFFQTCNAGHLL